MKKPPKSERKVRRKERDPVLARLLASPRKTALVLFAVAFLVYANSIGNAFVWDDFDLIVDNPAMGRVGLGDLGGLFTSGFWSGYEDASYYRPVVAVSYHVQNWVFKGNPAGFHFANVMWNALACVLVFVLLSLLFRRAALAAVTALLFALHPIHTESVAWVSGRTDVLSTLWALAALVLYVVSRQRRKLWLLPLAWLAFLVSLLAKESAVFVPLVVVLMELPPLRALLEPRRGVESGPVVDEAAYASAVPFVGIVGFLGAVAGYLALRGRALDSAISDYAGYASGALGNVALPLSVFAGYVGKLVFPFHLNAEWDAPVPASFANLHVIAGAVALVVVFAVAARYRRVPEVVLGVGFFLFGVAPVLNIIPIGEISAERFLYFPSLGFVLVLGAIFAPALVAAFPSLAGAAGERKPAWPRAGARQVAWVLVAVLFAFAVRTVSRNPVWKNEEVLFTATVEAAPNSPRAHVNLGDVALRQGRVADAIRLYQMALEIDPDFTLALSNLAGVYVQRRRLDEATPLIERAVAKQPGNAGLLSNLGSLYFELGRHDDAIPSLERALEIEPGQPTAHFNLGLIHFARQEWAKAREHFVAVAEVGGAYHMALFYLAMIEDAIGNTAGAAAFAQRFLSMHPQMDAYQQRARALLADR